MYLNRKLRVSHFSFGLILFFLAVSLDAAEDKTKHHLFRPTPKNLMREMSTDRPDQTESPYTVDAGHVQIEIDAINATFDRTRAVTIDNVKERSVSYGAFNFKIGLLHNVDLQFLVDTHVRQRTEDLDAYFTAEGEDMEVAVTKASGLGDVQTRLKINLWGNDAGTTAFAIMPFFKWPLPQSDVRNGQLEGGVIFPLAIALPLDFGLGLQTQIDFVSIEEKDYQVELFNTLTVGRDLIGPLAAYVEFAALLKPQTDDEWQGQVDVGFTISPINNIQFDFGCNFGVTPSAPDYNPFLGLTLRL